MPWFIPSAFLRRATPLVLVLGHLATTEASRFALGYQREYWGEVDLDLSRNPGRMYSGKPGVEHLVFSPSGMNNWYLGDPGSS